MSAASKSIWRLAGPHTSCAGDFCRALRASAKDPQVASLPRPPSLAGLPSRPLPSCRPHTGSAAMSPACQERGVHARHRLAARQHALSVWAPQTNEAAPDADPGGQLPALTSVLRVRRAGPRAHLDGWGTRALQPQ